jgi:hypothetical protein
MKNSEKVFIVVLLIALVAVWGLVTEMSYSDEIHAEKRYCQMVEEGHWPDQGFCDDK